MLNYYNPLKPVTNQIFTVSVRTSQETKLSPHNKDQSGNAVSEITAVHPETDKYAVWTNYSKISNSCFTPHVW
jgi:hypothetical protein